MFKIQSARFSTPIGQALVESVKNLPFRNAIKTFEQDYNLTQDQTIVLLQNNIYHRYKQNLMQMECMIWDFDQRIQHYYGWTIVLSQLLVFMVVLFLEYIVIL